MREGEDMSPVRLTAPRPNWGDDRRIKIAARLLPCTAFYPEARLTVADLVLDTSATDVRIWPCAVDGLKLSPTSKVVDIQGELRWSAVVRIHLQFMPERRLVVSAVVPVMETPDQHATHPDAPGVIGINSRITVGCL